MSPSFILPVDTAAILITMALITFAAFRAVISRRLVTTPAYRYWALLTAAFGVLGLPYEANLLRTELGLSLTSFESAYVVPAIGLAGAIVGLALLDRIIRVGLDYDFFHRDILHWERGGRIVTWTIIAIGLVGWQVLNYAPAIAVAALAVYPLTVLAISTFRARDQVMLDYMRWFGLTILSAIVATTVDFFTGSNFLQLFVGFFLYRAAGSLSGSTFHWEYSALFNAPRDFVYSVYTNPNMLTKITKTFRTARLTGRDSQGRDIVENSTEVLGIKMSGIALRKYFPPEVMEEQITSDVGVGSSRFVFAKEDGATRVMVSIEFEPAGPLAKFFGGFGANRARKQFKQDFEVGKRYCEANKPQS